MTTLTMMDGLNGLGTDNMGTLLKSSKMESLYMTDQGLKKSLWCAIATLRMTNAGNPSPNARMHSSCRAS